MFIIFIAVFLGSITGHLVYDIWVKKYLDKEED